MAQLRTRRRNGRIQYYNPKTKKFQNTKPTVTKPTPTPKPDPNNKFSSASQKGSRNFSGSKSNSSGGAGYADDIAKLKELAKRRGPQAKAALAKLAKLGIRVAPGAAVGAAMLTTIGKPNQSRMSKFGSLTGRQAPVTNTPTPTKKKGMSNIPPKEAQPGSPSYVKPKSTGGSGSGNRKNVTPTTPKRKPQAEVGSKNPSKAAKDSNMKAWAKANPDLAKKVKKGQAGYEAIQSVINPNAKAKPANVGPVKDGAKYARSLAKSNEKKKKQRRFSNESLRRAGQRTYNRGAA